MGRHTRHPGWSTLALLVLVGVAPAQQEAVLQNNPFDRPAVLDQPVSPASTRAGDPQPPPVLSATLVSAEAPMAILGGTLLHVGAEHAGYRLLSVEEGVAVFEHQGKPVRLEIATPQHTVATGRNR